MVNILREAFWDYVLAAQTDEELDLALIREWYDGRQFDKILTERSDFIAPQLLELLKKYPLCNVVARTVNIIREKMRITALTEDEDGSEAYLELVQSWWKANKMKSLQSDLYERVLRDKACVLIVGWDGEEKRPTWTINELWDGTGGTCRLHFGDNDELDFVSKRWNELDDYDRPTGRVRYTLYYPDRIERWIADSYGTNERLMTIDEIADPAVKKNPQPWVDNDGKPLGMAAVAFYNTGYVSEAAGAMSPQAAINEGLMDLHTTGRYYGYPAIVFKDVNFPVDPTTGREIVPKWGPGVGLRLEGGDAHKMEASDIGVVFQGLVMPWLQVISFMKGWPMHVFTTMPSSGELVRQMESSLISQVDDKHDEIDDSMSTLFKVSTALYRLMTGKDVKGSVKTNWRSAIALNQKYDAETVKLKRESVGISEEQGQRELGYTPDEIETMRKENDDKVDKAQAKALEAQKTTIDAQTEAQLTLNSAKAAPTTLTNEPNTTV